VKSPPFPALLACSAALLSIGCVPETGAPDAQSDGLQPALELTGRVVDAANILSVDYEVQMTNTLAQLETDTGVQLVVVTTPDLEQKDIADYTLELANDWGVGSEEHDDGLVLLVAPNEREVRIEVGFGLEASVKDEEAAAIIREDILPQFRDSNYEAGVANAVDSLIREVTSYEVKDAA